MQTARAIDKPRFGAALGAANDNKHLHYDARGNVTQLGGLNFVYDLSDQPVSISGSASGTYKYDGNFKRVKSLVNGKTIYNVYNAAGTLTHVDRLTDNKNTDYIGTIARVTNDVATFLHADHLGSANTGTSANGLISWRQQFTPFGEELITLAVNKDLAGFTGHIKDSATGLNYMQSRYYAPQIGRFLSIDPIGFSVKHPEMFGRYTYVGNDPVNGVDPTGQCPWCVGALIGGGLQIAIEVKKGSFKGGWKSSLKAVGKIGVSTGAGAAGAGLATKTAQLGGAIKATSAVGKLAGGAVGTVTEGALAGGVAGGLNEAGQQVVESGEITDAGAVGKASTIGAIVGGGAGGLQAVAKNTTASASGVNRNVSSTFNTGSTGFAGGARTANAGVKTGVVTGQTANAAASCKTDGECSSK